MTSWCIWNSAVPPSFLPAGTSAGTATGPLLAHRPGYSATDRRKRARRRPKSAGRVKGACLA